MAEFPIIEGSEPITDSGEPASSKDALTYRWAGFVLRVGFYASLGCMAGGLIWWLLAGMPGP